MGSISASQHLGIQGKHTLAASSFAARPQTQEALQPGQGGLHGHMVGLGIGKQALQLHAMTEHMKSLLVDSPRFGSPYDDLSVGVEEHIQIFNRDTKLHQEIKSSFEARQTPSAQEKTQLDFQVLASQVDANRKLPADDGGGWGVQFSRDRFFQSLETTRPLVAGDKARHEEARNWAAHTKDAFTAFFTRLWEGVTGVTARKEQIASLKEVAGALRERVMQQKALGQFLVEHLKDPDPRSSEARKDMAPAKIGFDSLHICEQAMLDLPRTSRFIIGDEEVGVASYEVGPSKEQLAKDVEFKLLKFLGGDKDLCLRVSQFTNQRTQGFFHLAATKRGLLRPDGLDGRPWVGFPQPKEQSIQLSKLNDGRIRIDFTQKTPEIPGVFLIDENGLGELIELDSENSSFEGRFSIVVHSDGFAEPYGDAVEYKFHLTSSAH